MTRRLQQRVLSSLRRTDSCHREARLRVEGFCGTLTPLATHYETLGLLHKVSVANNNLDQLQPRTKCDLKASDLHKLQTAAPVSFPANIQQEDGMDEWRKGSHLFFFFLSREDIFVDLQSNDWFPVRLLSDRNHGNQLKHGSPVMTNIKLLE